MKIFVLENTKINIEAVIPTDRPELIFKLSDGRWQLLAYKDLVSHKPFIPPNEWKWFSYNANALRFKKGLVLTLDWIIANTKTIESAEIRDRSLLISEKHYSTGAYFAVSLFPFAERFLGIAETDDFRGGMAGSGAYTLQQLQTSKDWRVICSKAGGDWLTILFDSRQDWSKDALIDEIIKKITNNLDLQDFRDFIK
ncbi:MAG: hypothetical protein HC913_23655, partial [Microscillaceae bacterium]|nr:hypothetical protein [Microscillaceae bacterium]